MKEGKKLHMKKGKKLLLLGIILTYVCMATACSTNNSAQGNNGSGSSLAGAGGSSQAGMNGSSQAGNSSSQAGTNNGSESSMAGTGLDSVTDSGTGDSLLEDAGRAVDGALDQIGDAASDAAKGLTNNGTGR